MNALAELLGDSPTMETVRDKLYRLLDRLQAGQRLPPVLLQGETGTGKGLIARLLHRQGARRDAPFVDVNCAAIPETLLEAELFGFERGAFTDARRAKPGLFHAAHGGVLFLDEVALLPDSMQAKLLTAIEERAVRRLGSTRREPADVWVISATNADLAAAVRARRFREDLYHRLAVFILDLPPLRDRSRDILLLAERFLARACAEYGLPPRRLDPVVQAQLLAYAWPGNIRELGNMMERAALLSDTPVVTSDSLGPLHVDGAEAAPASPAGAATNKEEAQRRELEAALEQTRWNISLTATRLGIARNTVYARLARYGLRPEPPHTAAADGTPRANALAALPSGVTGLLWERRNLALLRADLRSRDAVDAWSEQGRALDAVIAKVQSFGGRVEEVTPTGLVAVFGLEPTEDAARRAAHAAIAMRKDAQRARASHGARPDMRIALHVAPLLIGRVGARIEIDGSAKRAEWPVLEQLMHGKEPDDTIASAAAAPFLERRFELTRVDGADSLEPIYRLTGQERRGLGLWGVMTPFVGRHEELGVLRSRVDLADGGRGQVVAIVGEAGVGKSRLIYELAPAQHLPGWRVLETSGISYGQAISYLPVIALLKGYFALQDQDDLRQVGEKVTETLLTLDADLQPALPAVLSLLDVPVEDAAWRALDQPQRRRRTLDAVRRLLLREARARPLLLVFEDLHWIDSQTQAVLDSLVEALGSARLCILVSYRPEYQHAWGSKVSYTELRLDPLPATSVQELLEALLGTDPGLTPLQRLLIERTQGNPFFLEESVRALVEMEALAGERGAYRLTQPVHAIQIPPAVQTILAARIDRLAPEDKRLLQAAALIGKDVPVALLQAIAETDETSLQARLERLQVAEFLYKVQVLPDAEYTFKHALTHEVAYASLLEEPRRTLHARIIDAIERLYPDRLAEQVEALAVHAVRGKVWDKALDYCRQVGARDFDRRAFSEASTFYEQALEALGHLPTGPDTVLLAVELRRILANVLSNLGYYPRSVTLLGEAEALARQLDDPAPLMSVLATMSWTRRMLGDSEGGLAAASEAVERASALGDAAEWAFASYRLGQAFDSIGDFRSAADMFRRSIEALGPPDRLYEAPGKTAVRPLQFLSYSYAWLAKVLGSLGEFVEGRRHGEHAKRLATLIQGPAPIIADGCLGLLHMAQGDFSEAIPGLKSGLALCRAADENAWAKIIAGALGEAYARAGRLVEGVTLLEQEISEAFQWGALGAQGWLSLQLGTVYLLATRLDEARHHARRALDLVRQQKAHGLEAAALFTLGEIHAHPSSPEIQQAETSYQEALELAELCGMRPRVAHCHLGLGKLYRRTGKREQAREHFTTATTMYREMDMAYWSKQAKAELAEPR